MEAPQETQFEQIFVAVVQLDGINPYVDVPHEIRSQLAGRPNVPVLVRLSRAPFPEGGVPTPERPRKLRGADRLRAIGELTEDGDFRSTVVVRTPGPPRLFLDQWMREASEVAVGESVYVALEPDHGSRELALPDPLREGLERDARAKTAWENLAPSRRREILSYLNFLKTTASLEKNVKKTLESLTK